MRLNKTLAATLVGMFLAQALAVHVAAQDQPTYIGGSDLVPVQLTVGKAVVNQPTTVTLFVKNVGDQTFQGSSPTTGGWQVVLGYGDTRPGTCFFAGTPETTPCYQRVNVTDRERADVSPLEVINISFTWTPTSSERDFGKMWASIQPFGCSEQSRGTPFCPLDNNEIDGPDTNDVNNVKSFSIFVMDPALHAIPVRATAPNPTNAKINDPWARTDVQAACEPAPKVTLTACKPIPGNLVVFAFNVYNDGNAQDTFYGTVVDPSGTSQNPNLTNRDYTWTFVPTFATIAPRESREVRLEIFVPPSEQEGNASNIAGEVSLATATKVRFTSLSNPDKNTGVRDDAVCNEQLDSQELCLDPTWPSLVVGVKHGLNATTIDNYRIANLSEDVTFNITLNNTGNALDTYSLTIENDTAMINGSWRRTLNPFETVPAFQNRTIEFALRPPDNATKGLYQFNVTLQSVRDNEAVTRQTLRFAADLQQKFLIHGGFDVGSLRVVPAETAPYVMHVVNDGNGPDNATLTLENAPFGWGVALSTRTVALPPFGTVPVYLNLTPPPNTRVDDHASVFINVTSQGPADRAPEQRSRFGDVANVTVRSGPNIEVVAPVTSAYIDPGATVEYTLTLRNTGNVRDNFTVVVDRAQDQLAWGVTFDPQYAVLDPLNSKTVRVTLTAPAGGSVGETTRVFVTVRSFSDSARFTQTTLQGQVSGPDLFVDSVRMNATSPYSGDPVELNVILGNAGNKAPERNVTLQAFFVQGGISRPIGEKSYRPTDLPGGRRLTETLTWDTAAIEGTGVILVRVDDGAEIAEIDETNNEASRAVVLRVFDIVIQPAEGLTGRPGEKLGYSESPHVFLVEYRGNQLTENVTVLLESEHGWLEDSGQFSIGLPRGTAIPIIANVRIPTSPGTAKDTLRIAVVPVLRPDSVVSATTITTVEDEDKPVIRSVTASPPTVKLGEPVTLRADITDATGLSSVRAFVVTPANETQTFLLQRGAADAWTHAQPFPLAGTYRVFVEAVDGSDLANKNTSRDTLVVFNVTPGSQPEIKLAEGQVATVRTGSLVKLNITDPLGIGRATYTIRGIEYALSIPYTIDTTGLSNGTVDVSVRAENIYGVPTIAKITLTIDNSPPGIRSVTLNPAQPRANEDATLRIETDAKVSAVDVLIKKGGQVVETRAAVKRSTGVFELLLNPGEGDYQVDVTARDTAGNVKLQEAAVRFSARPASPFDIPAPGLLAAFAAVGAALVVARALRRRG